jgi:hypothetical protein
VRLKMAGRERDRGHDTLCELWQPCGAVIAQSVQRLGYGLDDWSSRVRFPAEVGLEILPFTTASRKALGPTQPPIQWGKKCSFSGGKAAGASS